MDAARSIRVGAVTAPSGWLELIRRGTVVEHAFVVCCGVSAGASDCGLHEDDCPCCGLDTLAYRVYAAAADIFASASEIGSQVAPEVVLQPEGAKSPSYYVCYIYRLGQK